MIDLIELKEIVYDVRARDGTWCRLPYPNHSLGCPNFPECVNRHTDFNTMMKGLDKNALGQSVEWRWYAIMEEFDLQKHSEVMKQKHPSWTERQCRNLLYWQQSVRKRLREKTEKYRALLTTDSSGFNHSWNTCLLEVPEAHGINVFATMAKAGTIMLKNPDVVKKVMFLGIPQISLSLRLT